MSDTQNVVKIRKCRILIFSLILSQMQRPFSCDMVYVSIHIVHRFAYDPLDIFQRLRILVLIHHGLCLIKIAFVTDQNNFGIIQPRPCSPGTLCSPKKKCVIVLDGGAIQNADKIVLMQIDQQAAVWPAFFAHQFRIASGRIVLLKIRRKLINFYIKFHFRSFLYKKAEPTFSVDPA